MHAADLQADPVAERLAFLGVDAAAREALRRLGPDIAEALPRAYAQFSSRMRSTPETRRHFPDDSRLDAVGKLLIEHWKRMLQAEFDADYAEAVRRVGDVHARVGLEPHWYIGGYALMVDAIIGEVLRKRQGGAVALLRRGASEALSRELGALVKAVLLDIDLALTAYLDRMDAARRRAEAEQAFAFESLSAALRKVAAGQLAVTVEAELSEKSGLGEAVDGLRRIVAGVRQSSAGILRGTREIAAATEDLARRTEQQAASLEETAASVEELTRSVKDSAERARRTEATIATARADAERGGAVVSETEAAMRQIAGSSRDIAQILGVIDEIAFQTNLLALNAGVEAARAGEAGRGFAVVASEVRMLAQRSAEAARSIKALIDTSAHNVNEGVRLVEDTAHALNRVVATFGELGGQMQEMVAATDAQANSIAELNVAVGHLDQMTQQNAAMVEQSTAASAELARAASGMAQTVERFRLDPAS